MAEKEENFGKRVIAGGAGPVGGILRGVLRAAEPVYTAGVNARNRKYDTGRKQPVDLGKPVISIGNITTGGTGKTPTVRWLCEKLLANGVRPAVLMRGYKANDTGGSDEQRMLDLFLGPRGVVIEANPDRVAGAESAKTKAADLGAFVLDDGFQHRRVKRDLDIVLVNAMEPFGFDHVLPRGLLREPLTGLKRASAVVITHARRVDEAEVEAIQQRIANHNPGMPVYCADHAAIGFRTPNVTASDGVDRDERALRNEPVLAFCGLGSPRAFEAQLKQLGARVIAHRWFKDHHAYTPAELEQIYDQAAAAGAKVIVTTEKDWVKLKDFPQREGGPPIWRLDIAIRFWFAQEGELMDQVRAAIGKP